MRGFPTCLSARSSKPVQLSRNGLACILAGPWPRLLLGLLPQPSILISLFSHNRDNRDNRVKWKNKKKLLRRLPSFREKNRPPRIIPIIPITHFLGGENGRAELSTQNYRTSFFWLFLSHFFPEWYISLLHLQCHHWNPLANFDQGVPAIHLSTVQK